MKKTSEYLFALTNDKKGNFRDGIHQYKYPYQNLEKYKIELSEAFIGLTTYK